jgi:hypothetical protein
MQNGEQLDHTINCTNEAHQAFDLGQYRQRNPANELVARSQALIVIILRSFEHWHDGQSRRLIGPKLKPP